MLRGGLDQNDGITSIAVGKHFREELMISLDANDVDSATSGCDMEFAVC